MRRVAGEGGRLGLAAVVIIGGLSCDGEPNDPQPTTGTLSGVVRDATTGAPIDDAFVLVVGQANDASARDGSYRIDNLSPGIHQVTASAHRYLEGAAEADIRAGAVASLSFELVPNPDYESPPTITTSALPQATVGVVYEASLEASGGTPPYAWSWGSQGPPGLLLDAIGEVTGTPGYPAGTYIVRLSIQDAEGTSAWKDVPLDIVTPSGLRVTTLELRQGEAGEPYADTLRAAGGAPPYTFEWSEPSELEGLALEAATGALSGTPVTPTGPDGGSVPALVTVHDADGASAIASVALGVRPSPLVIDTENLPDGEVGQTYEAALQASGGYGPRDWLVVAGILPPGLTVYSDQSLFGSRIAGTPTVSGAFTFTLRASDETSAITREYTVEIAASTP